METTGSLCETNRTFEWEIEDFLLLQDKSENGYKSPQFSFSDVSWVISVYPYGRKSEESDGWIGLYLTPMSSPKSVTMNFSLRLKSIHEKDELEGTNTHLFSQQLGSGWSKFILRSNLIERKPELLPSGALTVICTLKNREPSVVSENTFLNAASQTEEGKGVWKLQQNLREIELNEETSDVILKVKDQEFKSHRCILAARSPVFSAMMKKEMKENVTGIIDIQDVDSKTFFDFLNYLYTGSTQYITSENVAKLYTAAERYQVEVLKENCLDHMLVNVSVEHFCDIFIVSMQHNEEKLKTTCIQYFAKHSLDIIQTCKWQSFLSENPIVGNELFIKLLKSNKVKIDVDDNSLEE